MTVKELIAALTELPAECADWDVVRHDTDYGSRPIVQLERQYQWRSDWNRHSGWTYDTAEEAARAAAASAELNEHLTVYAVYLVK